MISDSTLQIAFKKLPLVEVWWGIKEKDPQLSEKSIKILFSNHISMWTQWSLCTLTKVTNCNRLDADIGIGIHLFSLKADIKDILFWYGNYSYFS